MKEGVKNKSGQKEVGGCSYLNKNCWLVKNLNYPPYKRCQYCEFNFRNCLFLQYQIISLILILLSFTLFVLIEKRLSLLAIITVFALVIVYGYFFNSSTEKIIKANFSLKKAKDELKELTDNLEEKVNEQTQDIREKSRYLQELLNMKNDFLRVVNHQLNTPISIVRGAFAMMEDKSWATERALLNIKAGFERMAQTVFDFWDAYELEGEKMKMDQAKTDIAPVVEKLAEEKKKMKLAIDRKLKIFVEKPDFTVPLVWCDEKKITHVISNLLDNAVYYTREGSVSAAYELTGDRKFLKIKIKDTGVGVSKENEKILFQKFSRGIGATSLRADGSGLGLYIAKKIVEGNDGEIGFNSAGEGKCTTFSFTIPLYQGQKSADGQQAVTAKNKIVIFEK
ncbi:MAG: HAMP domain-containing sensor histidine kinase [Patescibacteria group bacterium]|nr:HAMP domain-containing sensor histidine kinase [Patescibacteria group bacterium]